MDYSTSRSLRATLRENSQQRRQAEETAIIKRRTLDRALDQDERAQALERAAEMALADVDAQGIRARW